MIKTVAALSLVLAGIGLFSVGKAHATADTKIHALVIGIDEYAHIGSLSGAVNDARDIADALNDLPDSDVTMLLDGAATRDAILTIWREKIDRLTGGDTLIITYAGHGGHEPEAYPGNETDGQDETLLLGDFSNVGASAAHRIRDDEIAELMALVPQDVTVIFLADSCHSGTVVRSTRQVHSYRYFAGGEITDDPLPPPPPKTRPDDLIKRNTIFLSAVADNEKAPEFLVGDEVRGALSIAFAEAMRGNADKNRDGALSKGELEQHVRETVKSISSGIQNPVIGPVGQTDQQIVPLDTSSIAKLEPIAAENPFRLSFDALPKQKVWTGDATISGLSGVGFVDVATTANLLVDMDEGATYSSIGDKLASLPRDEASSRSALQKMIDKQRVAAAIRKYDPLQPLDIFFQGGNGTYRDGDKVVTHVAGREAQKVWLIHLSSAGDITFLFPLAKYDDPMKSAPSNTLAIPLGVSEPFGADTMIAIEVTEEMPELDRLLLRLDGSKDIKTLWNGLHMLLGSREDVAATVFSFFTSEKAG